MVEKGSIIVDVIPRRLGPWGWPNAAGISGRMALERVAECRRNQRPNVRRNRWPNAVGISGRMGLEYAPREGERLGKSILSLLPELGTMGSKWGGVRVTGSSTS
jgi:hypothetical protein